MSWWETLHLVTWWKRLGISAIKTGQDAPSWIWCTERLSFFWGGHMVLQRFVHVRCHFQPLPTKLVFAYFDRGSYISRVVSRISSTNSSSKLLTPEPPKMRLNKSLETDSVEAPHNPYKSLSIPSTYGMFTYIWLKFMVIAGNYTIHGCYGSCFSCYVTIPKLKTKGYW